MDILQQSKRDITDVLNELKTDQEKGLSDKDVFSRLEFYGSNNSLRK